MQLHLLDFVMYFVVMYLIYCVTDDEHKKEFGIIALFIILLIATIIYLIIFAVYPDLNWVDILRPIYNSLNELKINW